MLKKLLFVCIFFLVAQQLYILIRYCFFFFCLFVKVRAKLTKQILTKPNQPKSFKGVSKSAAQLLYGSVLVCCFEEWMIDIE